MAAASSSSIPQSAESVRAEAHAAAVLIGRNRPAVKASGRFAVAPALFSSRRAA